MHYSIVSRFIKGACLGTFVFIVLGSVAGCGGGGDTSRNSKSLRPTSDLPGFETMTSSPHTVVPTIFLQEKGGGYASFASSRNDSSRYTGIVKQQLYLTRANGTVLSQQTNTVIGQYRAIARRMALVSAHGHFSSLGLGNDIQIGQQDASGFTFGLGGSPAVLQATITPEDVSGRLIAEVAIDANGGVAHTLADDAATMPPGSIRYTTQVSAVQPVLIVQNGLAELPQTLVQLQQQYGGTISSLGGVLYLSGMDAAAPDSAYAQLNGAVYPAAYADAGGPTPITLLAGTPYAYNETAAEFIAQRLQTHADAL